MLRLPVFLKSYLTLNEQDRSRNKDLRSRLAWVSRIELKHSRIEGRALTDCSNPCSCNDIAPLSMLLIRGALTTLLTKDPRYFNLHLRLF